MAALTLGAAAGLGGAWWLWWPPRDEPVAFSSDSDWRARVAVLAGDGVTGTRDGDAARARFTEPFGVAVGADGTVFVADAGDAPRIRAVAPDGWVRTIAGSGRGFADGQGEAARFDTPSALAIDAQGALYVADTGNHAIRRVAPDGAVTTLAGDGTPGDADGRGAAARFNGPVGVAVDAAGRVIVADTYNDRIRVVAPDGTVSTLAGGPSPGFLDGAGGDARFDTPAGVAVTAAGQVVVADTGNGAIRLVEPSGIVTTRGVNVDDGLVRPTGIAVDAGGAIVTTDDRGRIVLVAPSGRARTLAGTFSGFRDGEADTARFRRPWGVAVAGEGRLVVADTGNALVRTITAAGRGTWSAPPPPLVAPHFDLEAFAAQPLLWPLAPMDGPHEVAGTMGEARGGAGGERFHAGVDVRADEGTPVRAVRDGVVSAPAATAEFGTLNESVRIGPLTYVHIRVARSGPVRRTAWAQGRIAAGVVPSHDEAGVLSGVRVRRGTRVLAGDVIGSINPFNHVHLNVGWPGEEENPLRLRMPQFSDRVAPTIPRNGVTLYDVDGLPLTAREQGRLLVRGRVRIVVDAWDQADGNRPNRRLGLYALGFEVLTRDGDPAPGFERPRETLRFDRLSPAPDAPRVVYAPGSGIPFYRRGRTRFLYDVTSTLRDGVATPGSWDSGELAPGDYTLRVVASDIAGNVADDPQDVAIRVTR